MHTKDYILKSLQNYKESLTALNMLKLEMANFHGVTADEAIESLAFQQNQGERVQSSGISDRTAKVAMSYGKYCDKLNSEAKTDVSNRLYMLQREIQLLQTAVAGLPSNENYVIASFYFDEKTVSELAVTLRVSERTIRKYREDGIMRMVSIYHRYSYLNDGEWTAHA